MQPEHQLLPITASREQFAEAGLPFKTTDQARWAHRKRNENGLAGAFVRLGRNVYINVPRFHQLAAQNIA
ncbi:MAG TPA: hypothetical protein VN750_12450 [Steroidobacteraceae bacterium]|nr:hypothetical protein [Steroidobacteraceae bacterium]